MTSGGTSLIMQLPFFRVGGVVPVSQLLVDDDEAAVRKQQDNKSGRSSRRLKVENEVTGHPREQRSEKRRDRTHERVSGGH
jgi:hypothetical protein